ncbi:hypothetical protein ACJMK2_010867 [Sinanodonta woodiana]|uniref:Uncharacterized protein n=1 Tax=Sinanodonta woodiana TaxID=1069815 RepID=A0ABD3VJY3_SINWO
MEEEEEQESRSRRGQNGPRRENMQRHGTQSSNRRYKKAENFIMVVSYTAYKIIAVYQPSARQWRYGVRIVSTYYKRAFQNQPTRELVSAAKYVAATHYCVFPEIERKENEPPPKSKRQKNSGTRVGNLS